MEFVRVFVARTSFASLRDISISYNVTCIKLLCFITLWHLLTSFLSGSLHSAWYSGPMVVLNTHSSRQFLNSAPEYHWPWSKVSRILVKSVFFWNSLWPHPLWMGIRIGRALGTLCGLGTALLPRPCSTCLARIWRCRHWLWRRASQHLWALGRLSLRCSRLTFA